MRYAILDQAGEVENVIIADDAFCELAYPGRWRRLDDTQTASFNPDSATFTLSEGEP